jgi:hypothetical protein
MQDTQWLNPVYWRDLLPREIAVQVRLNNRKAYEHNVHRYYGHRVNIRKCRYRVCNEICDLGNLLESLDWYSRQWRRRYNMDQWLARHPTILDAFNATVDESDDPDGLEEDLRYAREQAWKRFRILRERRSIHGDEGAISPDALGENTHGRASQSEDILFDDYNAMSDIDDWHDEDHLETIPPVIPKWFLWRVFDQFVDAYSIMGSGRVGTAEDEDGQEDEGEDKKWDEIVHRDGHLQNIFVKPLANANGELVEPDNKKPRHRFDRFGANQVRNTNYLISRHC